MDCTWGKLKNKKHNLIFYSTTYRDGFTSNKQLTTSTEQSNKNNSWKSSYQNTNVKAKRKICLRCDVIAKI